MADLLTPFRSRYERSLHLDVGALVEECADYLQHPDILISEFLEAYYAVERKLDPEAEDEKREASLEELVLESFSASRELEVRRGAGSSESLRCVGGPSSRSPGSATRHWTAGGSTMSGFARGPRTSCSASWKAKSSRPPIRSCCAR